MIINNFEEVKKIMEKKKLNLELINKSIKQIEECANYNAEQIYTSELTVFINNKEYLFEMTVKKYDKFLDENGCELFGDDIEEYSTVKIAYDVLSIAINSLNGSNENCFVFNF